MVQRIAVIGAGTMGNGIAHVFAQAGFQVSLADTRPEQLDTAIKTIGGNLDRQITKGFISGESKTGILGNISTFTRIDEAVQYRRSNPTKRP